MKTVKFILLLLFGTLVNAQEFQGIATYRTSQQVIIKMDSTKISPTKTKKINENLSNLFDEETKLLFTKNESVYKEVESLDFKKPQAGSANIVIGGHGGQQPLYRNLVNKTFVSQEELMGKRFLIKDFLIRPDWKLETEQKKIGKYNCYKATWTRTVVIPVWTEEDGAKDTKVNVTTIAWYTPEIPVSHGPLRYWGLPGLILEIQEGRLSILCTEIIINPEEKFSIEIPDKGKEIDMESFVKIREEKNKEMLEQFQRGKGTGALKIKG